MKFKCLTQLLELRLQINLDPSPDYDDADYLRDAIEMSEDTEHK